MDYHLFEEFAVLADYELAKILTGIHGVGERVADSACLFSFNRTTSAPVGNWIQKMVDKYYERIDPLCYYGDCAESCNSIFSVTYKSLRESSIRIILSNYRCCRVDADSSRHT